MTRAVTSLVNMEWSKDELVKLMRAIAGMTVLSVLFKNNGHDGRVLIVDSQRKNTACN